MGTIIAKNVVERKKDFLYYVDGKGNVCEAKMAHGGKKKSKEAKQRTIKIKSLKQEMKKLENQNKKERKIVKRKVPVKKKK